MPIYKPALLEKKLDAFDPRDRRDALEALLALTGRQKPADVDVAVNMHCPSFFSANVDGRSPTRIAWACHRQGYYAAALCDADVLDGLDEFLRAGLTLGLRTAVHLETRAGLAAEAGQAFCAPGEPGVVCVMGAGFVAKPAADSPPGRRLAAFRNSARARHEDLIARINGKLPAIRIQYIHDVHPLTPLGAAADWHIVRAYVAKARQAFADADKRAAFWAPLLKRKAAECKTLADDEPEFTEAVCGALAGRGGIGYAQPDGKTLPSVEEFIAWVRSCDALPAISWRAGADASDWRTALALLRDKGCAALDINPDCNRNTAKPRTCDSTGAGLDKLVRAATDLDLPINFGAKTNCAGDDFFGPEFSHHRDAFVHGAQIMVGHTLLARYAAAPYLGERAQTEFPRRKARNRFYASVGALPPVTHDTADKLLDAGADKAFAMLADAAKKEH